MARERVFNPLKRKVLRKRISSAETRFGVAFIVLLAATGVWIFAQKSNFNPADRDISIEVLETDSVEDTLYQKPLKLWQEPGTATGGPAQVNLGLFPASILNDGWTVDGRVESYDPDNLYEKINGAAEQYLSFGFEKLHYVTVGQGDNFVTIEIYDQGSFPNTLGIFAAQRDESRSVVTKDNLFYYPTPIGAVGGLGRYYFKIAAGSSAELAVAKAGNLLEVLAGLPAGANSTPRATTILTLDLDVPFDQLAYVPTGAFQYGFAEDFWFGSSDTTADARFFVHQAATSEAATTMFQQLVQEQGYEYSEIESTVDRAIFQHDFLNTFFMIEVSGKLVFGIDGSLNRQAAESDLQRIRGAVHG